MRKLEIQVGASLKDKDEKSVELQELQAKISTLRKQNIENTKRMNLFALAKSNKEFSDIVTDAELKEIHRQYD